KEIEEITGKKIKRLFVVGGGTQNQHLMQLTADALECNVIAGPTEGAVIGNAGVQAIATGAVSDLDTWRSMVASSFEIKVYEPHASRHFVENEEAFNRILED
ncbi:MAG: hypothetical protein B7Z63_03650, partial [Ignavibacteriae bacterium 37-53-5]